jgi:hypothetical protein
VKIFRYALCSGYNTGKMLDVTFRYFEHVLKICAFLINKASMIFRNLFRYPKITKFCAEPLYIITVIHKKFGGIWINFD